MDNSSLLIFVTVTSILFLLILVLLGGLLLNRFHHLGDTGVACDRRRRSLSVRSLRARGTNGVVVIHVAVGSGIRLSLLDDLG